MASHGKAETEKLIVNLQDQLNRLMEQLEDLDKYREDMDPEEYNETKEDTIEQLKEFKESLRKIVKGDISLISKLDAVQLATQLAISEAFKTPEVIRLFAKKEPTLLRDKLKRLEQTKKSEDYEREKAEILSALRQLGEQLTGEELQFLEKHNNIANAFKNIEFVEVGDE